MYLARAAVHSCRPGPNGLPGRRRSRGGTAVNTRPVVVLTALDLEYTAISGQLSDLRTQRHEGTRFEIGTLPGGPEIALGLSEEGGLGAAALAERARAAFRPMALLMVGVAGGLKDDIQLGDVVVATKVYSYQGGKVESDGLLNRPQAWESDYELRQLAHELKRSKSWGRYLTPPRDDPPEVHFKPIAAGDVVLNSRETTLFQQLHHNYNDAAAIEMESAGVAKAGQLSRSLPVLTIRGISDRADGAKRAADAAGSQSLAAGNAAAFALALAAELHAQGPAADDTAESGQRIYVQNIVANGGLSVGVQDGTVRFHDDPPPA
jgi:nucleoside phosphorylase